MCKVIGHDCLTFTIYFENQIECNKSFLIFPISQLPRFRVFRRIYVVISVIYKCILIFSFLFKINKPYYCGDNIYMMVGCVLNRKILKAIMKCSKEKKTLSSCNLTNNRHIKLRILFERRRRKFMEDSYQFWCNFIMEKFVTAIS